jgi:hypothetical protein
MTTVTIQQVRGPNVTIAKSDGQSVSVNQTRSEITLQAVGIQGGRGPAGEISQDPGDIAAIFESA